jgi:hypothetical protein
LIQEQKSDNFGSFPLLKQRFPDDEMYDLLTCTGICAYDYYNSASRLDEVSLPPIEAFYNSLTNSQCTTGDYKFAKRVWAKGGCKNGSDYCKLSLAIDVMTLLDIVRKNTDKIYGELGWI